MANLTEDIRSDLTKIFSERNEVVAEDDNQVFNVIVKRTQSEVIEVIAGSPEEAKRNAEIMAKRDEINFQGEGEISVEMYDMEGFASSMYGVDNEQVDEEVDSDNVDTFEGEILNALLKDGELDDLYRRYGMDDVLAAVNYEAGRSTEAEEQSIESSIKRIKHDLARSSGEVDESK